MHAPAAVGRIIELQRAGAPDHEGSDKEYERQGKPKRLT
jgi:hypothetical protein